MHSSTSKSQNLTSHKRHTTHPSFNSRLFNITAILTARHTSRNNTNIAWISLAISVLLMAAKLYKKLIRRWDSKRELFFTATSLTTFMQCTPEATKFGKETQNKGHYAIQGHRFWYQSKAHIRLLLVINTNLPPILHCSRDIAFDRSKITIFGYPACI